VSDTATPTPTEQLLEALARFEVHDVSPLLSAELPMWFLYKAPRLEPLYTIEQAGFNANELTIAEHSGTHVDAPAHFVADGQTADQIPVDALFLRPFKKFDLTASGLGPADLVTASHLIAAQERAGFELAPGDVAVLELGWDRHLPGGAESKDQAWWGANQPGLGEDACRFLADAAVAAVASDTAAADVAVKEGEIASGHGHSHFFLPVGILIVEGLHGLAKVPTTGLIAALPLKIAGGTGSPLRIVMLTER
jgi:kynurenine formamidase